MRWWIRWLPWLAITAAGAVEVGDTRDMVLAELGSPSGHIRGGDMEILYYPSGTVHLRDGRVTTVEWRSEEETRARLMAELEARRRMETARRARRVRDEERLRALVESDDYRLMSPSERIERLAEFARLHPEVSIAGPLLEAQRALSEERRREARAREVAEELERHYAELSRRATSRGHAPPYMVSAGTTVYFVRPWTFADHFGAGPAWLDRPPDCHARAAAGRASSGSSTWPYNFGMGEGGPRLGPRSPGMRW